MSGRMRQESSDAILVERLSRGATQVDAALDAGVTTRTVRRRLADASFVGRVRERRSQLFDEATVKGVISRSRRVSSSVG